MTGRRQWLNDVRRLVAEADVIHSGFVDPIRPLMYDALKVAFAMNRPTVAYRDTDTLEQIRGALKTASVRESAMLHVRAALFARMARHVARSVDLLMLKGQSLMRWLGPYARCVHSFQDTSYLESEMAPADVVERRVSTLSAARPIRLVYCGRLVERKGLAVSIDLIDRACRQGARLNFDVIGDGPQRPALEAIVRERGLSERVRFLGSCVYGPALLERLAAYDAMFFTPIIEDTPRMIFDGYAAGLPLIGSDIEYVRERADEENATVLLPRDDVDAATAKLVSLSTDHRALAALAFRAHDAGKTHAADRWYERRAKWTIEAVDGHANAIESRAPKKT
jgi:glycosyltransferase involved in cell wall biosynthesis